jgi:hypothetical protein
MKKREQGQEEERTKRLRTRRENGSGRQVHPVSVSFLILHRKLFLFIILNTRVNLKLINTPKGAPSKSTPLTK